MVLNGEKGLECEVHVDGIRLEHVLEFKYVMCFGRIRYRWGRMQQGCGELEEGCRCHEVPI